MFRIQLCSWLVLYRRLYFHIYLINILCIAFTQQEVLHCRVEAQLGRNFVGASNLFCKKKTLNEKFWTNKNNLSWHKKSRWLIIYSGSNTLYSGIKRELILWDLNQVISAHRGAAVSFLQY